MIDSAQLHRLMTQVPTDVPDDIQRIIVNRNDMLKLAKLIQREALLEVAEWFSKDYNFENPEFVLKNMAEWIK
jgi:hypothetical protein